MPQITETDLEASAPSVRALLVARLEQMWKPVKLRLEMDEAVPVDPRILEIGLRVIKEEALLYRMYKPPTASVEEDELVEVTDAEKRKALEADLAMVEARINNIPQ